MTANAEITPDASGIFSQQQLDELNLLLLFDLTNHQEGIKIHSTAAPAVIAAAQRLCDKGLTTLPDGGYLTHLGIEAAEFAQSLSNILRDD